MGILDRAKSFVNHRPIATGLLMGGALFLAGMPILAGVTTLFVGSGAANATIKYLAARITPFIYGNALPENTIRFTDKEDGALFEFHEKFPSETVKVRIPASDGHKAETYSVNPEALLSYLIYRRELVRSYGEKEDLAPDIKYPTRRVGSEQYRVPELVGVPSYIAQVTNQAQKTKGPLNRAERGLNDYSIAITLDSMQRWKDPKEKMQSFVAYENVNGSKSRLGFVLFQEKEFDGRKVIYIAEAAVSKRGDGIGRRLMECVLAHFPVGTEFHILARKFNTDAKVLYGTRLGFEKLDEDLIEKHGYGNDRYIGYRRISTDRELSSIRDKQIFNVARPRAIA